MRYCRIPDETVQRLLAYLRGALHLSRTGATSASSKELAALVGVEPWQIRKDFSYFGDFGTPGVGYDLRGLIGGVNEILHLHAGHKAALVGVGNLGSALLAFPGFRIYGFEISAAFDTDGRKIGRRKAGVLIEDMAALDHLNTRGVRLGIITVPEVAAQEVADALVRTGIKGILNFTPRRVVVPQGVKVTTIDIAMDLARLPYYLPGRRT